MDFAPGGAARSPQTVIDLNGASNLNDFGFYDSGNYDANTSIAQQHMSGEVHLLLFYLRVCMVCPKMGQIETTTFLKAALAQFLIFEILPVFGVLRDSYLTLTRSETCEKSTKSG